MAYIPEFVKNSSLSQDTLNAIGTDIGVGVTVAKDDLSTLHTYGKVVLATSVMQNQFLSALVNRIILAYYTSRQFNNPLKVLKGGILEFGETIEEIFVEIAKGVKRNENKANPSDPYQTTIPDVKTAFHLSNLRCRYPLTIYQIDLRKAFLNFSGVDDMIARLVESVYNAHEWDEYLMTKYVLATRALERIKDGKSVNLVLPADATEAQYATALLRTAREYANILPFPKTEYNMAGVATHTPKENIICFLSAHAQAVVDVDALAGAFNMSKADFLGRVITLDNFTFTDYEIKRICDITGIEVSAFPISQEDMTKLEGCGCMMADEKFLQIYDNVAPRFTENYFGSDDYWNYWLHIDQTYSSSPFLNFVVIESNNA